MNPVRIVVADDHDVVRSGFASLLDTQPEFSVVGTAANELEAVRLGRELQPDVILMDIRMPGIDGIEATRRLTGQGANRPRILVLTTFDLDEYVYDALRAGASGFLLKDVTAEQLFEGVRVIAAGDALLAPGVTRRLISEFAQRPTATTQPMPALQELTPRETQVLRHVARACPTLRSQNGSSSPRKRSRPTSAAPSTSSGSATAHKQSSPPTRPGSSHQARARHTSRAAS